MPLPEARGEGWFATLYTAHYPLVMKYALRRMSNPDSAEELAQEVFVVAWRRRADVPGQALPWLYGVARRLLANHWRASRASPRSLLVGDAALYEAVAPDDGHSAADQLVDIRRALATLSPDDQELLRLIGWEQLSLGEAATVLGCSRATAAVRLHRARGRLARALSAPPATTAVRTPLPNHP
jgi:RNA polymerase sigma factor (sigma-70 family)